MTIASHADDRNASILVFHEEAVTVTVGPKTSLFSALGCLDHCYSLRQGHGVTTLLEERADHGIRGVWRHVQDRNGDLPERPVFHRREHRDGSRIRARLIGRKPIVEITVPIVPELADTALLRRLPGDGGQNVGRDLREQLWRFRGVPNYGRVDIGQERAQIGFQLVAGLAVEALQLFREQVTDSSLNQALLCARHIRTSRK